MEIVTKEATATVEAIESGSPTGAFDVILSTDALDRDGEELRPDEWKTPLPDRITFDSDHGMSVATTVGSGKPFINTDGQLQVRGTFASTQHAQTVRALVNEGHISTTSVAFKVHRNSNGVQRELLNGAFVAVPANPEAVVLSSKADKPDKPYGDVTYADPGYQDDGKARYPIDTEAHVRSAWSYVNQDSNAAKYSPDELSKVKARIRSAAKKFGIEIADESKSVDGAVFKQGTGSMPDMLQAIHDAAVHLGAMCGGSEEEQDTESAKGLRGLKFYPDVISKLMADKTSGASSAGSPMETPTEESAVAAVKAAAPIGGTAGSTARTDESADSVALRARALAMTLNTTVMSANHVEQKEI